MEEEVAAVASEPDKLIRQHLWFDFHVLKYDGHSLTVAGGIDLTYCHTLEIRFEDIFFASVFFQGWKSDTKETVIEIPSPPLIYDLNKKFEIEQGYQLFVIKTEDYDNDVYIAARSISYNTDTVFYYKRENLRVGERLAEWLHGDEGEDA